MRFILQIIGLLTVVFIINYWYLHYGPGAQAPAQPDTATPSADTIPNMAPPTEPPPNNLTATSSVATASASTSAAERISATPTVSEPITIDILQLPEGQQAMLRTIGLTDAITLSPEIVACAETDIGANRLAEIVAGAIPSLGEGMALVGCYRR